MDKYKEIWGENKNEIEVINANRELEYGKDFMKIKLYSDDNLPLKKQLKFSTMAIIVKSLFEEDGKVYPQIYLDECLNEL